MLDPGVSLDLLGGISGGRGNRGASADLSRLGWRSSGAAGRLEPLRGPIRPLRPGVA